MKAMLGWGVSMRSGGTSLLLAAVTWMTVGCANPGPPRAPSLELPEIIRDLRAQRDGAEVTLYFTPPSKTTDGQAVGSGAKIQVCRQAGATCKIVLTRELTRTVNQVSDSLPDNLLQEPAKVISYKIQTLNTHGRSAGWSAPVTVAGGPAPPDLADFKAVAGPSGLVLTWAPSNAAFDSVEILRRIPGPNNAPEKLRVGAVSGDPGGAVDAGALAGQAYLYEARRVRMLQSEGKALRIESKAAVLQTPVLQDTFPPAAPRSLSSLSVNGGIDMSWEPNTENDLAGYLVYRDGAKISDLISAPQFSDRSVQPGRRYAYVVTAVDKAGNESRKSESVTEMVR